MNDIELEIYRGAELLARPRRARAIAIFGHLRYPAKPLPDKRYPLARRGL